MVSHVFCQGKLMTMNCAPGESTIRFVMGVGVGLFLSFSVHLHGSVVEGLRIPDRAQSSDSTEKGATRSGVCEREAEKLVGQKPVRIGGSVRAPQKLRDVPPKYPEQPPGTVGSGMWLGEALINNTGRVAHVWPIREVKFVPP